jgi:hypothetical protein
MTIQDNTMRPTDMLRAKGHAAPARRVSWLIGAALAAPLAFAQAASAQDYEYEPDEGWHEEEWYDPTDWFDDRPYNYEFDYDDYEYDDYDYDYDNRYYDDAGTQNPTYGTRGWDWQYGTTGNMSDGYGSLHHDAYLDGYYDGYYDDEFGIDHWDTTWSGAYSVSYSSGYYDGHYDSQQDYAYEPTYYLVIGNMDNNRDSQRQRAEDDTRRRGDRADRQNRQAQRAGWMAAATERTRGTIERIQQADVDSRPEDHTVLRLRMEDGETVTADFGPRVSPERLPFSQGDRVTLAGDTVSRDGEELFVVEKILTGDHKIKLRRTSRDGYNGQNRQNSVQPNRWMEPQWENRNQGQQQNRNQRQQQDRDQWQRNDSQDRTQRTGSDADRVSMSGELSRVQRANRYVEGYILYRVQLNHGQFQLVAVQPDKASRLRMQQGDRVELNGKWDTIDGQRMLVLSDIRARNSSGAQP